MRRSFDRASSDGSLRRCSTAARKAVQIPLALLGGKAVIVGADELLSEAYAILTECALPPRERLVTICSHCNGSLENVRSNARPSATWSSGST